MPAAAADLGCKTTEMPHVKVILCEKSGRWAAALRRALRDEPPSISETRSLSQCEEALAVEPAALVAIEVNSKTLDPLVQIIARVRKERPFARVVALLDSGLDHAEPVLREAGAVDIFPSLRDAPMLAQLARRHLALTLPARQSVHEAIAEQLPWKRSATPEFGTYLQISTPFTR
jgi:hypothetical protein